MTGVSEFWLRVGKRDVRAWVNGAMSNYGWAILPRDGGGDGWAIATFESSEERARPRLRVYYDTNTVIPVNLVIEAPVVGSNGVQIHSAGSANPAYSTWRAAAVNGPWSNIGSATSDSGGAGAFTDNSPLTGAAYYRISTP